MFLTEPMTMQKPVLKRIYRQCPITPREKPVLGTVAKKLFGDPWGNWINRGWGSAFWIWLSPSCLSSEKNDRLETRFRVGYPMADVSLSGVGKYNADANAEWVCELRSSGL
jgi:hypothetical protein